MIRADGDPGLVSDDDGRRRLRQPVPCASGGQARWKRYRWLTYLRWWALGDLFLGPYPLS